MSDDKISLDNLIEWTTTQIHYYLCHRAIESDKKPYLDKIIAYCENEREKL